MRKFHLIVFGVFFLLTACTPQAVAVTPTAILATETSPPPTSTPEPTITPTQTEIPLTERDWDTLTLEEKKTVIELSDDGDNVYAAIEIPEEDKLIYYDGAWHELYALWAFNDQAVPMGKIYDINDPKDAKFLENTVLDNDPEKIERLHLNDPYRKDIKYVQFYPDNETWNFEETEIMTLGGVFTLQEGDNNYVVNGRITLGDSLTVHNKDQGGTFSVYFLADKKSLRPVMIGIVGRSAFDPEYSTEEFPLFGVRLDETQIENNLIGSEDIGSISEFIEALVQGKYPVVVSTISLDTIDKKE